MATFTSIRTYRYFDLIAGKARKPGASKYKPRICFMVALDQDYDEAMIDDLEGQHIIDGVTRDVVGVQKSMHEPPWRSGEQVGLVVDEDPD